jgi:Flp pilus assembly protein TadG
MAPSYHTIKLLHGQRGAVLILFALCLLPLLNFIALAVDLAWINLTKVELQNAADAAALAGARSLSDALSPHWSTATTTARNVARRNFANAGARIRDTTIETGYWNINNPSLGLRPSTGVPVGGDLPAIRATVAISSGQNSGPLTLFFATILGIPSKDVQASAIAVLVLAPAPGGGTGAYIPKLVQ